MTTPTARLRHIAFIAAVGLVLGTAGSLAVALPASAAIAPVDSLTDDGVGFTLREAVLQANADAGADVITFDPALSGGTLVIDSSLSVSEALTITGLGSDELTIIRGGAASFSMLSFQPPAPDQDLILSGITLAGDGVRTGSGLDAGGAVSVPRNVTIDDVTFVSLVNGSGAGASINNISGALTVSGSRFEQNIAETDSGGGLWVLGALSVTLTDTAFVENEATLAEGGAASFASVGAITVTDSTFTDNGSSDTGGGAIALLTALGPVTVENSTFAENLAFSGVGGAIYALNVEDELSIRNSTFRDNRADRGAGGADGGAIFVEQVDADAVFEVDSSTFTGNTLNTGELGSGGGVSVAVDTVLTGGIARVINSTAYEPAQGSAFSLLVRQVDEGGLFEVVHSTIVANGGLRVGDAPGRVSVNNSIIDGDVLDIDASAFHLASGEPIHLAWSALTDALDAPIISDEGGNQFSVADLKLGPLQDNGGPTFTMLPLAGSPVIDKGDPAVVGAPSVDQRGTGFARILGGRIDIGAVETPHVLPATGQSVNLWIPIGGGILLLLGIGAFIFARLRGKGDRDAR